MTQIEIREGDIEVPGGRLHFRLSGSAGPGPVFVLENGWSASFPCMAWLEAALAPHGRVMAYDRAGVGHSRADAPPSVAGITQQLLALLDALELVQPVTIIGHSYGGLIGSLHQVQAPQRVRCVVQVDPTPEFDDPVIDPSLRIVPGLGRLMQVLALLKLDRLLMPELKRALPAEAYDRLSPGIGWMLRSLEGSIDEIRLLAEIRRTVTASPETQRGPRLVVSAEPPAPTRGWLAQRLANPAKEATFRTAAQALHRRQAALHPASRWMSLPYGHVGLLVEQASAARIATATLEFLGKMNDGL